MQDDNIIANYWRQPYDVRLAHPELAAEAVRETSFNYQHVPVELRRGNWELAELAVNLSPLSYQYVPDEMKDVTQAASPAERERIVDLATRATRTDGHLRAYGAPTPEQDRNFIAQESYYNYIGNDNMLKAEHMPAATQRMALSHMYTTGQHAVLRGMHQFSQARQAVCEDDARARQMFQILSLRPHPPHEERPAIANLVPDMLHTVVTRAHNTRSVHADHDTWAAIELRKLWYSINALLLVCRTGPFVSHYFRPLARCTRLILTMITHFCDPHYAWSVSEEDPAMLEPVPPLTPSMLATAAHVAENLWSALDVLTVAMQFVRLQHGMWPTTHPEDHDRMIQAKHNLTALDFQDPLPPDQFGPLIDLLIAYLNKPPTTPETLFSEDYPEAFPEVRHDI